MNTVKCLAVAAAVVAAVAVVDAAKVKVTTNHDKDIDFRPLKTFAWHPDGAADVKLLQATGEDPEAIKARFDGVIRTAVERGLTGRGLSAADAGSASLLVNYYLLIGPGGSSQYMGQFIAPVPFWGLPPFAMSTTALTVYEQGTLIVDLSSAEARQVVWRGSAEGAINRSRSDADRDKTISSAIADMFKKFPPKR